MDRGAIRVAPVLCLVLPPLAFWALAVAGSFNIGYRHLLPSLPFLYILAAWSLSAILAGRGHAPAPRSGIPGTLVPRSLVVLSLLWLAFETVSIAPHYLAYFNQIAGGPGNGYRVLVDSNLDWGQDLPALTRYARENKVERIYLRDCNIKL